MTNENVLEIKNITVDFDGFCALLRVNVNVKRHTIHFFIGPNGAGKTTLLDIICAKTKPTDGVCMFYPEGRTPVRITGMKEYKIVEEGIGRKFQVPSVFVNLTVMENMILSLKGNKGVLQSIFYKLSPEEEEHINEVLKMIELLDKKNEKAGSLAHGQKQWLEIGMQLVQRPEVIMLDEPAAGMGKPETFKSGEILKKIKESCTIIVVEHDMDFVKQISDHVTVLHEGKYSWRAPVTKCWLIKQSRQYIWEEEEREMLKIKDVDVYYGESKIITSLSMDVEKGKIVCLIGRNGVGKSTTLKSIMGLVKTPKGSIKLDGEEIMKMPTYNRVRKGVGYVPQGRDIFPQMTVYENLMLGLQARGGKGEFPKYIYELFPVLKRFEKRKGGDLSGGQQQLAIARALVTEPKILILDEPTEGIQPSVIQDIGNVIRKINKELGLTVLIVEQYLDFVLGISDYMYIMEKGDIILKGSTSELDAAEVQEKMTH